MPDDGDFRFEGDLAGARTIPARWYHDPALFEREQARVFARTWQLVGRAADAAASGDYFTCRVGREPLLVARDEGGTLRALSNVCRHRAGPVAQASTTTWRVTTFPSCTPASSASSTTAYRVETAAFHSRQHAPLRREGGLLAGEGDEARALYYWVFPNLMLNFYPGNLQANLVVPLGPERTRTRFEWYVAEPLDAAGEAALARSVALSEQVQREDMAICEAVQEGLRSATYRHGRYSVLRENGVHHFHGLLCRFLT